MFFVVTLGDPHRVSPIIHWLWTELLIRSYGAVQMCTIHHVICSCMLMAKQVALRCQICLPSQISSSVSEHCFMRAFKAKKWDMLVNRDPWKWIQTFLRKTHNCPVMRYKEEENSLAAYYAFELLLSFWHQSCFFAHCLTCVSTTIRTREILALTNTYDRHKRIVRLKQYFEI